MVSNQQVRRLFMLIAKGTLQYKAADIAGMCQRTARTYIKSGILPQESAKPHDWRTRSDPFKASWDQIIGLLEHNPGLQTKTIFQYIQRQNPEIYQNGQLRTLQRKIKQWRAVSGPAKEVFFSQVHIPGELSESDFTHMGSLGVTIAGEPFDHLAYHFVLTYSDWEDATIAFSESFESMSSGYQAAVWHLGGVSKKHRTDRMSAAVNKDCNPEIFTQRYSALMRHYNCTPQRTNPARGNENGDVEQRHYRFKTAVAQALMLRGSKDFDTQNDYDQFLRELLAQLNAGRQKRLQEERIALGALPARKLDDCTLDYARVSPASTIHIHHNTYSVHSRLIGERVQVRTYADHLEIWYAQRKVEHVPRLRGKTQYRIDYRHIIDWLVRKPGAFQQYRYKSEMFPSSNFRIAYDYLKRSNPLKANKEYITILHIAAQEGQARVESAIRRLISQEHTLSAQSLRQLVLQESSIPLVTDSVIDQICLTDYDQLLDSSKEAVVYG